MWDLVVRGGTLVDGTGSAPRRADLGIRAGRIAAEDDLTGVAAADEIDATGRLVLPGFVDAHSHGDARVLGADLQLACLRQGVTTLVLGQDGVSYAPADPPTLAWASRYFGSINGVHPDLGQGPVTVAELRATWHHRTALNTAYLVPHGTVRHQVLGGADRTPDSDELSAMRALVERGLADGAVGVSSGLEYSPARFADAAELAALCRPVAEAGLPYVTHMRGYGVAAPRGLAEAVAIARASGAALHVSHLHGPAEVISSLVDSALADGVDVSFDTYPYRRGCTLLAMAALPPGVDDLRRARLDPRLWPRITFAHVPHPDWDWVEGLSLPDAAARADRDPGDLLLDVLAATGLAATGVITQPATTAASIRSLAGHPRHVGGSDGIAVGRHPHPRAYGAFARFLGWLVRGCGDWSWAQAAQHLAARPAARFGLTDRGILRTGAAADVCVVDPATVTDRATYAAGLTLAIGVDDVVVNGSVVLRGGALTGAPAGTALTPGGAP